jgi:flagellar basal body P-ring protein FlgI
MKRILVIFFISLLLSHSTYSKGLNGLSSIVGVRGNPLAGYGLVVGLNSTKSKVKFNRKNIRKLLIRLSRAFPKKIDRRTRYNKVVQNKEMTSIARSNQTKKLILSSADETNQLFNRGKR